MVWSVDVSMHAPGVAWDTLPARCQTGKGTHIIRGGTDTRPCDDFATLALVYVERYNRELTRLCTAAPH